MPRKKQTPEIEINERPPYMRNLIIALALATVLFVGIFLLGYTISYQKYQGVLVSQEQFRYNLLSFEVEREILGSGCSSFDPYLFSEEMDNMGAVIGLLEDKLGKNDAQVLSQKKIYSLLEARHFLYVNDHNEKCGNTVPVILFFYSNKGDYKEEAEKLGFMLSSLKKDMDVMIYSFDYDLDSSLISIMKDKYDISRPNIIVADGKTLLNVFENVDDIKKVLK